jgi:hypothetical protein
LSFERSTTLAKSKSIWRIVLARQHGEADHVLADSSTTSASVTKLPERLDIFTGSPARSSRTIWTSLTSSAGRPASACTAAWVRLTGAGMVGAPDVDELVGRLQLLQVVGRVGREVGPAAVRLLERPILVVAVGGGTEQQQLDRLPIVRLLALGRLERAAIDEVARGKRVHARSTAPDA